MNMEPLVPHILIDDEDYQVFLELISIIHDDIKDLIAKFPELVDIDNAPEIFLPKLSALIRYKYRYDIDEDIQREIIKRMISIYRDRGTDDSIIMAATYGDDPMWIGSHVFLPGADINRDKAEITHSVDEVFRHSISKFSGTHRYADGTRWLAGTITIKVSRLNNQIREAIKKVVPAGLRVYFDIVSNSQGSGDSQGEYGELIFGEWNLFENYEIDYQVIIHDEAEVAVFDMRTRGRRFRSGRQLLFYDYGIDYGTGASMLPIEDNPIYVNAYLRDAKPDDLIRTENRRGQVIYKRIKNLSRKDYLRINKDLTAEIIADNNNSEIFEDKVEIDRTYLPDLSTPRATFSGSILLSGRHQDDIPESEGPSAPVKPEVVYQEFLKTSLDKDKSLLVNFLEVKLGDAVCIDNNQEEDSVIKSVIQHNIDYFVPGFDLYRRHTGIPTRSTSRGRRSGKYALSGTYTGEIYMEARIEDVIPRDRWYPVSAIMDLRPGDYSLKYKDAFMHSGYDNKFYEGIRSISYAKLHSCYIETTAGVQLITEVTAPVIVVNLDGTSIIDDLMNLDLMSQVKCYSLDIYLRNYTTDAEVSSEKFEGAKSIKDITLDTLVQSVYDTQELNEVSSLMVEDSNGQTRVDLMNLRLDQVVQTYSNKQIV